MHQRKRLTCERIYTWCLGDVRQHGRRDERRRFERLAQARELVDAGLELEQRLGLLPAHLRLQEGARAAGLDLTAARGRTPWAKSNKTLSNKLYR